MVERHAFTLKCRSYAALDEELHANASSAQPLRSQATRRKPLARSLPLPRPTPGVPLPGKKGADPRTGRAVVERRDRRQ